MSLFNHRAIDLFHHLYNKISCGAGFHCHAIKKSQPFNQIHHVMSRIWDMIENWHFSKTFGFPLFYSHVIRRSGLCIETSCWCSSVVRNIEIKSKYRKESEKTVDLKGMCLNSSENDYLTKRTRAQLPWVVRFTFVGAAQKYNFVLFKYNPFLPKDDMKVSCL